MPQYNNDRPVTTLLIGLGGSGAWTVVHVKRQLYDAYNNRIPDNIALAVLDTAKTVIVNVGSGDKVREPGMGTGRTEIDRSELAHVGGDVYELMRDIDEPNNPYPHIKSWLMTKQFLETLPRAMFNIDQGAGQFRQFGRIAMFRDVMAPAASSIAAIIDNKLRTLNQTHRLNDPAISVVLTGSLAGGTGAGMFIDMAHLIQRVAYINNIKITLRGFFYMPQAFAASLSSVELEPAKGRAYAALRELKRFLLNSDYQYGYPMYYHGSRSGVNQDLWRATNQGKLFDFVYLIDGQGNGQNRMNNRKLEEGSAPSVADAIMAFLDENYGPKHDQYVINTSGKIQERQGEVGRKAFVSTLGAYSIILPIQQIVEGWAYRLSRDLLGRIVPIKTFNERGYALEINRDANPEQSSKPRDEVQRIATTKAPVVDHRDPNNRTIVPLPLWDKVFALYTTPDRETQILRKLSEYQLVDWVEMLVPPQSQTDRETTNVLNQIGKVLSDPIEDHVKNSEEVDNGDPSVDWQTIKNDAEGYINRQLGQPASGGGRMGGTYREEMARLTQMQVKRFRDYMASYIHRELNGEARQDIISAKTGKLGWLMAVVEEFRTNFMTVNQHLDKLRAGANTAATNRRAEVERALVDELRNMVAKKDERRILPPRIRPAVDAQKGYIEAAKRYVEHYRIEFAREEVSRTLNALTTICDEILAQFETWTRVLATHNDSLHNKLLDGQNSVRSDRQKAANIANHRLINDTQWEEDRYNEYLSGSVREQLFRAWQWQTDLVQDGDKIKFAMSLNITSPEGKTIAARNDINRQASNWPKDNHDLLMETSRQFFRDAIRRESVLAYLMQQMDERRLADELSQKSGFLLSFNVNQNTNAFIPGTVLLAKMDPNQQNQLKYMREVSTQILANQGRGNTQGQDNPTHILESCTDPFRLTLLSTAELIPMESINAYKECEEKYWNLPYDTRQKNHIFPAEVHAVRYEKDLSARLHQPQRALSERVALLLEDEDRYRNFLQLVAHNMIEQATEDGSSGMTQTYWRLLAPSQERRRRENGELEYWRLTDSAPKAPSLMEAAVQYIIIGHDFTNKARPIPYDHIRQMLDVKREIDTDDRLERDEIAVGDAALRQLYEAFLPPLVNGKEDLSNWTKADDDALLEVAKLVVRHDILDDLANDFNKYLTSLGKNAAEAQQNANTAQSHNDALFKQELYDLFSISVIALKDEAERLRDLVQQQYDVKTKGRKSRGSGL